MAAPDTSADLSVVEESTSSDSPPVADLSESNPSAPQIRRGVPWWVLAVVVLAGVFLFLQQYQRAQDLGARVNALTEELLVADQRLQIAQGHIAAHQAHLDQVRVGIADLSATMMGLRTLANQDPLAPPVSSSDRSEALASDSASDSASVPESATTALTAPSAEASEALDADSRSIVHETMGAPISP